MDNDAFKDDVVTGTGTNVMLYVITELMSCSFKKKSLQINLQKNNKKIATNKTGKS